MAIRKDIDDMLNSLKGGAPASTPKKPAVRPEETTAPIPNTANAGKIDKMSVDDLLSSISSSPAATAAEKAPEKIPEETPVKPRRKIVISGELPDYEALRAEEKRKEQLERERIEAERAAAEKAERARIKAEKARLEAEKKLEEDRKTSRIAAEMRTADAMKAARMEAERRAAEEAKALAEKRAAEEAAQLEAERRAAEDAVRMAAREAERKAAEEAARIEAERLKAEEAAREAERHAAEEAARMEAARIEAEKRAAAEAARRAEEEAERRALAEAARLEAEKAAAEEEARAKAEKQALAEAARLEAERRAEEERFDAELEARIRAAAEAEAARIEAEQLKKEREAAELEERLRAAAAAETVRLEAEKRASEEAEKAEREAEPAVQNALTADINKNVPMNAAQADGINDKAEEETVPPEFPEEFEFGEKKSFFKRMKEKKNQKSESDGEAHFAGSEAEMPKSPGKLTSALRNILDEDPNEIVDRRREQNEAGAEAAVTKGGFKKGLYTVLGIIFAALACVGLVTVIATGINKFSGYTSGDNRKDALEAALYPAVIMDIESFNDPSELPSNQIITAAIWSMLMTDGAIDKYEKIFDVVIIPAVDVESYAVKLFGNNLPAFEHMNVGPSEAKFYYNEEKKAYNVPITPITHTFAPEIREATKNGSEYTVVVDYIDELPSWLPKTSTKSVEFKMVETNEGYELRSMKILSTSTNSV